MLHRCIVLHRETHSLCHWWRFWANSVCTDETCCITRWHLLVSLEVAVIAPTDWSLVTLELNIGKTERALKSPFYGKVLQKQAISQLCEIGEWNFTYVNTIKTAFIIWQSGDWPASTCVQRTLLSEEANTSISLEALWSLIFKVFSHMNRCHKLIAVVLYYRDRHKHTHTLTQAHRELWHRLKVVPRFQALFSEHVSASPPK